MQMNYTYGATKQQIFDKYIFCISIFFLCAKFVSTSFYLYYNDTTTTHLDSSDRLSSSMQYRCGYFEGTLKLLHCTAAPVGVAASVYPQYAGIDFTGPDQWIWGELASHVTRRSVDLLIFEIQTCGFP